MWGGEAPAAGDITFGTMAPLLDTLGTDANNPTKVGVIAQKSKEADATVRRYLDLAERQGWVVKTPAPYRYHLTATGRQRLDEYHLGK